jgi:spore maturation protein CgeB
MRIFSAVRHSNDPRFHYGGLWSGNFYPALRQLGHEIVESQVDLLPASRFMHVAKNFTRQEEQKRAEITERIIAEVKRAHAQQPLDVFLSYFYNAHFDPSGFDEIKRLGIPTVNFYCNSIYQFELVSEIAPCVTFAWHAEKHARPSYQRVGANPVWVQMAADPEVYRPVPQSTVATKACFVGQKYADRDRLMYALVNAQVPIDVFGPGWIGNGGEHSTNELEPHARYLNRKQIAPGTIESYLEAFRGNLRRHGFFGGISRTWRQFEYRKQTQELSPLFAPIARGPIPFQEIAAVFSAYEVILNFSNVWADGRPGSELIPHVRLRDFEAPMSRACYLTGYTEEIAEFYELGVEIDTYRSAEELVDKTKFYLTHPQQAEALREAGYRRALRDHTWERRFEELFRKIGLSKSAKMRAGALP